ncbi:MAG: amidohydrolase, partial [Gammaproteobacteria bacterium]|nr:amidohydrolase [Gammaproteobacteria bacterium]
MNTAYSVAIALFFLLFSAISDASDRDSIIERDYEQHLGELFEWFHRNPELSTMEVRTAARLATELRKAGF